MAIIPLFAVCPRYFEGHSCRSALAAEMYQAVSGELLSLRGTIPDEDDPIMGRTRLDATAVVAYAYGAAPTACQKGFFEAALQRRYLKPVHRERLR